MSSSAPEQSPDDLDPRGLESFRGSDDRSETTSFSRVMDNAGNEWQFPPIPAMKLHKLTRMAHWLTAEEFFGGEPPVQVSLWAGEKRLRHLTMDGEELGTSVLHGELGVGRRYVVHQGADGREIAILSIISAAPERSTWLGRLLLRNAILLGDRVRYELRAVSGNDAFELPLAHSKAGRYLRYKGFTPPAAG